MSIFRINTTLFILLILILISCKDTPNRNSNSGEQIILCDSVLEIYIHASFPKDTHELAHRQYLLVSPDTLFTDSVLKSNFSRRQLYDLFLQNWDTPQDWYTNAFLFSTFNVSPYSLKEFEPCNIEGWRLNGKEKDYEYWMNYFGELDYN